MLNPFEAIDLLMEAGCRKVELNNDQPHKTPITLADTLEARAAELISHYQRREKDLIEANDRYLARARKAEGAIQLVIALRGYTGCNMGRVAGYRVAADLAERGMFLTQERIIIRMAEKIAKLTGPIGETEAIGWARRIYDHAYAEVVE